MARLRVLDEAAAEAAAVAEHLESERRATAACSSRSTLAFCSSWCSSLEAVHLWASSTTCLCARLSSPAFATPYWSASSTTDSSSLPWRMRAGSPGIGSVVCDDDIAQPPATLTHGSAAEHCVDCEKRLALTATTAPPGRFELPTVGLEGRCSIQLSYRGVAPEGRLVGVAGFEPTTTSTQSSCTTRLCDTPLRAAQRSTRLGGRQGAGRAGNPPLGKGRLPRGV